MHKSHQEGGEKGEVKVFGMSSEQWTRWVCTEGMAVRGAELMGQGYCQRL